MKTQGYRCAESQSSWENSLEPTTKKAERKEHLSLPKGVREEDLPKQGNAYTEY